MTRNGNAAVLLGIVVVMTVAGPSICRAQDAVKGGDGPELDAFNFAFMSVLGSGFFLIDGREALILRAPISFKLRDEDKNAYGVRLRVPVSLGWFNLDEEDVFDTDFEEVGAISIAPGVEFHIPLARRADVIRWKIIPFGYAGIARDFDGVETAGVAVVGIGSRAEWPWGRREIVMWNELLYATNFRNDALLDDDFARLRTDLEIRFPVLTARTHTQAVGLLLLSEFYFNEVIINRPEEPLEIRDRWEIGVTYGTVDRRSIWRIPVPRVGIGYRFGQGVSGVVLRFRFRY